jgi:hypothetical protein
MAAARALSQAAGASTKPLESGLVSSSANATKPRMFAEDGHVENVVALLMWMAKDQEMSIPMDDIKKMALDVLGKWDERNPEHVSTWGSPVAIDSQALARLSKLIDIMMTHKDGSSKDPTATLAFMRRCVAAREEVLTNKDTAAEHVSKKDFQE